ncbi:uncharacterized protein PFL1_05918 [Pseudozyma flocculosa PF-1]|uniref:Uncharacterized protein n=2 Tax=Pseudozyma flocculosa TaxID=84751 RepID=A0A5C3F1T5_9BASI|nr:uncharacterized protein PFL1_05918 [Pseudozyma flocculosa PF-1]EPQ26597.1 hypothetical protein PFL1_05918 [Pseudozyma flocculosa PF-1]SPO38408.1 uncharacterized protein PSFLO_03886 [Pseudozyma flocculosa]
MSAALIAPLPEGTQSQSMAVPTTSAALDHGAPSELSVKVEDTETSVGVPDPGASVAHPIVLDEVTVTVTRPAQPAAKGRRKRAAAPAATADIAGHDEEAPARRSKRAKKEVNYKDLSLAALASTSASLPRQKKAASTTKRGSQIKPENMKAEDDARGVETAVKRKNTTKAKAKGITEVTVKVKAEAKRVDGKKQVQRKRKPVNPAIAEIENDPKLKHFPQDTKNRMIRVLSQRMFLINRFRAPGYLDEEFDILGSVGDVYKVTVSEQPRCSCMDYRIRKVVCKHLLFVYLKVLRLPRNSPVLLQRSLTDEQLFELFEAARPNPVEEGVQAPKQLRRAWEESVGLRKPGQDSDDEGEGSAQADKPEEPQGKRVLPVEGDSCPVCYEDLDADASDGLTFCATSCGRPLHDECFEQWCRSKGGLASGSVTCVWCRAPWAPLHAAAGPSSQPVINGYGIGLGSRGGVQGIDQERGVLNLAEAAGVSTVRDTSTYGRK